MSFFGGIVPTLETFDDDEVVEFQLRVMQLVSEIKKRKMSLNDSNATVHPSTSCAYTSCLPPHQEQQIINAAVNSYPPTIDTQYNEQAVEQFSATSSRSSTPSQNSENSSFGLINF